jgi:hypothetical protein
MNALLSRILLAALCAMPLVLPAPLLADDPVEAEDQDDVFQFASDVSVEWDDLAPPPGDAEKKKKATALKKKKEALKKAVASAYAPVFYDNKFDYLCNPLYCDWYPGEHWKRMCVDDCFIVDFGGQYRMRYHSENNIRGLGYTGRDDDFLLHRLRLFMNAEVGDIGRVYVEYIYAESAFEEFPPRQIEVNRSDLLNAFGELNLWICGEESLKFRVGRQELLYGSERLISPLDWANARRTFDGAKLLYKSKDWNVDLFYTQPVAVDPNEFDEPIDEQDFFGTWITYKGQKDHTYDFYAIQFNNDLAPANFEFTTIGGRWLGSKGNLLWELEGGYQFGENTDGSDHQAGFYTAGVGRKWPDHCWKPTLWCYYDWASGGDVRGAVHGFHHLFPLAHKYFGFMDLFGRSNIESPNVQLTLQPCEKIKLLVWYYYLMLENINDTPYNVNMTPFNTANAPASRDLGHEVDLLVTYTLNPRSDIVFGYSHFFPGDYYRETPGINFQGDADFFYTQFHWNF